MGVADVSVPTLIKVLEAVSAHPHSEKPRIAEFAGSGASTTGRALASLTAIGLVHRESNGRYGATAAEARRGMSDEVARNIIRRSLISYRPFEAVCEGLTLGEPLPQAIRKATVVLGLAASDQPRFAILTKWALDLGLFIQRADDAIELGIPVLAATAAPASIVTREDVESETKARLYVAGRLGRDVYNQLDEPNRRLLAEAVLSYQGDPAMAVEKAGQALENFLRELAEERGLGAQAKKLNGAGQVGSMLVSNSVIHSHQQKLVEMVSTLRNAKAHHKDKKTLLPWTITDTAAFASVVTSITVIRSISEQLSHGAQIL